MSTLDFLKFLIFFKKKVPNSNKKNLSAVSFVVRRNLGGFIKGFEAEEDGIFFKIN